MEQLTKEQADILNDLILINNDRITGYEKALDDLSDSDIDLKPVFSRFIEQSTEIKTQLEDLLESAGEEPEEGTTVSGKIYRAWMDVKAVFTGGGRKAALEACERGEDAAQKAYRDALAETRLPAGIAEILITQRDELRQAHDRVKSLRDSA